MRLRIVTGFTLLCGVLLFAFTIWPLVPPSADAAGRPEAPAPNWELKDLDGKTVRLSDFKGKVVVLDFWATWCPPCRKEIPGFVDLQRKYGAQGLVVIGVTLDEDLSPVKPFVTKLGINYPVVFGNTKVATSYGGVESIPTSFVINRAGNVVAVHEGYEEKTVFESEIKPLL